MLLWLHFDAFKPLHHNNPHIYLRKQRNRRNAICISDVEVITIRLQAFVAESWIPKIAVTMERQTVHSFQYILRHFRTPSIGLPETVLKKIP